MKKLLDALEARGVSNAIIVMDNAKYHTSLSSEKPRGGWQKADISQATADYCLYVNPGMTRPENWDLVRDYIQKNVRPAVRNRVRRTGHEVMYSPPLYCNLQPTKLSRVCGRSPKALLARRLRMRRIFLMFLLTFKRHLRSCSHTP